MYKLKSIHLKNRGLKGIIKIPGDKSISHRSIMLGSLAKGKTLIKNYLTSEDSMRTIEAFRSLGVEININGTTIEVNSRGHKELKAPSHSLDLGNSGTTTRLLSGILAGLPFETTIHGDNSLSNRPMDRVIIPLKQMGAIIESNNHKLPMSIRGGNLNPIEYQLPVDSAQIKSAILFAGLLTDGHTTIIENNPTRDHTERMLPTFGGKITKANNRITIQGNQKLVGGKLVVPGDISSASFWIAGAVISPESDLTIEDVGLNPTRTGFIDVLKRMGANIRTEVTRHEGEEPVGNIYVQHSELQPTTISEREIASFVDEVPLLALVSTQVKGNMAIEHIEELKYKESNRIRSTVNALKALGATIEEKENGIFVSGPSNLMGGEVKTQGDHRIAMMASVAALISEGDVIVDDINCINISYPSFLDELYRIN